MKILKTVTLKWWEIAIIKWAAFSAALLVAIYWPTILGWVTLWWIVFIVSVIWSLKIYFRAR